MEDDGAALCAFFAWLEDAIARCAQTPLNELMIDEQFARPAQPSTGFYFAQFWHDRGIQRKRCHASLSRHASIFRDNRGRRTAVD